MDCSVLEKYGIDSAKGLARCMNDEKFYEKLMTMFLSDTSYDRARAAFDAKDQELLFRCLHELKGACGNADMTELFGVVSPLVEYLRGGGNDWELISPMFDQITASVSRAREGVAMAING